MPNDDTGSDSLFDSQHSGRRVAFVTESFLMGGVERWLDMFISHLDRTRYEPILICSNVAEIDPLVESAHAAQAAVVRTDLLSLQPPPSTPVAILGLARMFRAQRVEVVHAQVLGGAGARSIAIAARLAGVRAVIVTIHGVHYTAVGGLQRILHRIIDRVFVTAYTTSSADSRGAQIKTIGREPNQIYVIPHAIECELYDPSEDSQAARRELDLPSSVPVIGMVGRMDPQKGVDDFLEMARLLGETTPEARFLIVGDGKERAEYEALAIRLGIADRVRFTGYRTDIARCLAAMDVFVLASLFEPFGLVLAEAMAMVKPIVATNVGGVPEVIADGVTGALAPVSDSPAMSEAVQRYLSDPDMARRHGQAGRRRVLEKFSARRMVADMERLYERCLVKQRRPAARRRSVPAPAPVVSE